MKLKLKETPEQIELIRAMGSKNRVVAEQAQEAFAAFIGPVAQKVLMQAGTTGMIYKDFTYDEDDSPSIPLDLYYGTNVDHVQVWTQNIAGGLPSSHVAGMQELKISTFRLDSAVNVLKKYARRARLDVISAAISRMINEVLVKTERNGWAVLLKSVGEASTLVNGTATKHSIASTTQNILQIDDFNRLLTLSKRLNASFTGGTAESVYSNGITDLFISPEMKEQIRAFAYQPMNTRSGAVATSGATAVPLPDSVREEIYRAVGTQEIYGIGLHELNELGITQKYNVLFGAYATTGIANGGGNFNTATDEILVGIDLTKDALVSPIAKNADNGATFTASPDDQWVSRSEKLGWVGAVERGFAQIDSRSVCSLIV